MTAETCFLVLPGRVLISTEVRTFVVDPGDLNALLAMRVDGVRPVHDQMRQVAHEAGCAVNRAALALAS
jgi:hypothetical protein